MRHVSGDCVYVWCVPPAAHVSCIHESPNKVLSTRTFVALFLKRPYNCALYVHFVGTRKDEQYLQESDAYWNDSWAFH
jgi:hypothetical protein